MNTEMLQAICEMTVRLTELKMREVPHLCIENFSPELFAKFMRETDERSNTSLDLSITGLRKDVLSAIAPDQ